MSKPFGVSVIMPAYNASRFLRPALRSLQDQVGVSAEIIVVDDGSADETTTIVAEIAKADERVTLVRQEHRGVAAARNKGLEYASQPFITFLDSDDICAPGKIQRQILKLDARPDITAVVGHRIFFDNMTPDLAPVPGSLWRRRLDICLASAVFRSDLFRKFGAFDATLVYGEDIDFYFRLFEADARFIIEMETAIYYRRHAGNMTNDEQAMHQACLRAYHNSVVRRRASGRTQRLDVFFFRTFDKETEFGGRALTPVDEDQY